MSEAAPSEEHVDSECLEFIVYQMNYPNKIHILEDKAVYHGDKHIISMMKRHVGIDQQKINSKFILACFKVPISGMLYYKELYKLRLFRARIFLWFWFLTTMVLSGYLIFRTYNG